MRDSRTYDNVSTGRVVSVAEKFVVAKEFTIPIGHRLSKNKSKCYNVHGHNFKFVIWLSSTKLNHEDMVIDFKEIKRAAKDFEDRFDHALVLNEVDELCEDVKLLDNVKAILLHQDPTAEVLARTFYKYMEDKFGSVKVEKVRVYENDTSYAEYKEEITEV